MDLCTSAGIVNGALKYVERKNEQLDTSQNIDEGIEEIVEERRRPQTVDPKVPLLHFSFSYFCARQNFCYYNKKMACPRFKLFAHFKYQ
jgi:hypothetical protein